jgi:hypothetical protein
MYRPPRGVTGAALISLVADEFHEILSLFFSYNFLNPFARFSMRLSRNVTSPSYGHKRRAHTSCNIFMPSAAEAY